MKNSPPIICAKIARSVLRRIDSVTVRRLTRLYFRSFFTRQSLVVWSNEGFKMNTSPRGYTSHQIYFFGEYDHSMSSFMRHHVEPGDHCIDVGAEQGWFSLLMASSTGKNGKVYSYEPFSNNYEKLLCNILLNQFDWIKPIKLAVSDIESVQYFTPPSSSILERRSGVFNDNSGVGFISEVKHENSIEIKTTTLDQYFNNGESHKIKLIKFDIEGSEDKAVKGGLTLIDKLSPILIIEYNEIALNRAGSSTVILHNLISRLGYKIYTLSNNRLEKFDLSKFMSKNVENQFCNVYCLRT